MTTVYISNLTLNFVEQRLREYAHIFINVLMYIEEEKDNKAKVVGKIYKIIKDASQATLFHYNFQGVTTSKVDISESFIPPEEYFTEDISLYKIGLKDWLEYLNMNKQTLEELIKFCEAKNLTDVATGLKKDLKQLTAVAKTPQ